MDLAWNLWNGNWKCIVYGADACKMENYTSFKMDLIFHLLWLDLRCQWEWDIDFPTFYGVLIHRIHIFNFGLRFFGKFHLLFFFFSKIWYLDSWYHEFNFWYIKTIQTFDAQTVRSVNGIEANETTIDHKFYNGFSKKSLKLKSISGLVCTPFIFSSFNIWLLISQVQFLKSRLCL